MQVVVLHTVLWGVYMYIVRGTSYLVHSTMYYVRATCACMYIIVMSDECVKLPALPCPASVFFSVSSSSSLKHMLTAWVGWVQTGRILQYSTCTMYYVRGT